MIVDEDDYLEHYGVLRRSGRYPYGSGGPEYATNKSFLGYVEKLRNEGLSDVEIAKGMGTTTTALRAAKSIAKAEEKQATILQAQKLKDLGNSNMAISREMGIPESSVRALLAPGAADKAQILDSTSRMLKERVDSTNGYLDVGAGTEHFVSGGISATKLNAAVANLREQGYELHPVQIDQLGTGMKTTTKVLCPPGTTYKDVVTNKSNIVLIDSYTEDGGRTWGNILPPLPIDSNRVGIRYAEDGGDKADGVIYVRPGKEDLSLGGKNYAQVRINIDGTHYLKGMAVYKDDLPDGVDLMFNTNKTKAELGTNKLAAMKPMKKNEDGSIDQNNPFGSSIRKQITKFDADGNEKPSSAMNIIYEEGNWDDWSRTLSSQTLSKQSPALAKKQLDLTYAQRKDDLDEIMGLTNPTVKRKLLETYAESTDKAAVQLKAAAMKRSSWHVILPMNSLKENEIYAPNFNDGERVALIRYPHAGKFEIPEVTVNNRHPQAIKAIGRAKDAVGINSKVAQRLSGADFDGDAVLVIPNNSRDISSAAPLRGLKDFDPQRDYRGYEGMKVMDEYTKGIEMGKVSNLITDMTLRGASNDELARAVRHSMVVIDAEKHGLNWKLSERNNGIRALREKYQNNSQGGASTLISRARARTDVRAYKPRPAKEGGPIDKATGRKVFVPTNEHWTDSKGRTVYRMKRSKQLVETDDAHTLSSGTDMEKVYANHSNRLKALANQARKEAVHTPPLRYSPSAKKHYAAEVESLNAKLNLAQRNKPLERQAQLLAGAHVDAVRRDNPNMDSDQLKKVRSQALAEARNRTGASRYDIVIEDREWDAIQAGAITNSKLKGILDRTDIDKVRQRATPRATVKMTSSKLARAQAMINAGYTQAEIANALGVSVTTLKRGIGGGS